MMLLPISPPWTLIGAAVVAASGFVVAGVQTLRLSSEKQRHTSTRLEYEAAHHKALRQAMTDRDAAQDIADKQARDFEAWKLSQKTKVQSIRKQVQHEQATDPVCSNRALPDGLRNSLARAPTEVGATDTSQPVSLPGMEWQKP